MLVLFVFFFFKQKTAYEMRISDWSSDVCSSDLILAFDAASGAALGLLLCLTGTYSASLGNMLSAKNQMNGRPILQSNAWGMTYGAAAISLYVMGTGQDWLFDPAPVYIGSLLFLALVGSILGFGTYLTLLGRIGPDR